MPDYVTDTHSLIWYLEDSPRHGSAARKCFVDCDRGETIIHVPTICLVEIIYLQEKGRIPAGMKRLPDEELRSGPTGIVLVNLSAGVVDLTAPSHRASTIGEISGMKLRFLSFYASGIILFFPLLPI